MKSIPFLLMTLLIIGCSSTWSTNSSDQEYEAVEAVQLESYETGEIPVSDIEPGTPLCETEHFGYVELKNSSRHPVRAVIGEDISVVILPNVPNTVQVSMGIREVHWWPNDNSYYSSTVYIPQCKSTANEFDPKQACFAVQDN